jgi:hypothetical protein
MSDEAEIIKAQAWAARSFCDPTTREIITGLVGSLATQAERVRVLAEALSDVHRLGLVIETAIRADQPAHHANVLAALKRVQALQSDRTNHE